MIADNAPMIRRSPDSSYDKSMSIINRMYYVFKPFLPISVRYTIRRLRANVILGTTSDWPIMHSASKMPTDWLGWPDQKKFALVLTHDVEGTTGLERCHRVLELEAEYGFRSAFNLIPEGEYVATKEIRDDITAAGFEVGVHDLRHDGSLYRSKASFDECAVRINRYLTEWDAVGFRAGFMFHNLEWLKTLNLEYDASTFDTDPFEPQPDGVGTIFPFWVDKPQADEGYVEIPYTLPQDATLFLVLREKTIDIWKRKTDWIVAHGGMVHINVHPDYLAFDGRQPAINEFSVELYAEFLDYIRETYGDVCWNALPREVARFYRSHVKSR
jgi:hypothetical protein